MPRNPHSSRASTSHPNRDISLTIERERKRKIPICDTKIRSKGTGLSLFTTGQQSHQDKNLIPAFPILVEKLDLYFPFGYKYKRAFETHTPWPRDKESFQQNNRAWLRELGGGIGWGGVSMRSRTNASWECAHCVVCEFTKEITFGLEARNWAFSEGNFFAEDGEWKEGYTILRVKRSDSTGVSS